MRYFKAPGRVGMVDDGGAEVELIMPDVADGVKFKVIHRFGDERGVVFAAEAAPDGNFEELSESDGVILSQLRWEAENPLDASGWFVSSNGRFLVAGGR